MVRGVSKKGAMELSMNTIVVVVIGITLLVLGLVFVRGIFTRLGGLGGSAFQKAEQELQQIQSGETKINFPQNVEVKKGGSTVQEMRICNTDGTLEANSQLKLVANDAFPAGLTITAGGRTVSSTAKSPQPIELGTIDYQSCKVLPTLIKATSTVKVDPNLEPPFLTLTVTKSTKEYHSMGATIEIT
ncbi:MAG: hypothetical protein Q8O03_00530 [Nanoarchaeota archaeon]|nr:hypothetical protein [Nanoarchaeota archaeon]